MKWTRVLTLVTALAVGGFAQAETLPKDDRKVVASGRAPYWNLQAVEASNTQYKLRGKGNVALGRNNAGVLGVGANTYDVNADVALTQGACNTLWGSATNREVYLYAAYDNTQATSTSASSPATDITALTSPTFKIAVDKNPVVSVTLDVTDNDTGAEIATEMEAEINEALEAASQGARVDVEFASSLYVITSRLQGNRSSVVVTNGASNNVADDLKIGAGNSGTEVAGTKGPQLCVSDVANKTTVGSTAVGNAGYASCSGTLGSATAVRQIASADLNCTGPVIGTLTESQSVGDGVYVAPAKKYGTATSTTTGATALVFTVPGLLSTDDCVVTPVSYGTGPASWTKAAVTAATITLTVDANQTAGTTTINYFCW